MGDDDLLALERETRRDPLSWTTELEALSTIGPPPSSMHGSHIHSLSATDGRHLWSLTPSELGGEARGFDVAGGRLYAIVGRTIRCFET